MPVNVIPSMYEAQATTLVKALVKGGFVRELGNINHLQSTNGASRAQVLRLCKKGEVA